MINRRRFLAIAAASLLTPAAAAQRVQWRGQAFGADVSISLEGERQGAETALQAALDTMRRLESLFSLFDPASALSQLNQTGKLHMPPEFARLVRAVDHVHTASQGLFDPTIQPLFAAKMMSDAQLSAEQEDRFGSLIDWSMVNHSASDISFSRQGMAITLNGIAQGFATDRVSEVLAGNGFTITVVNMGEYRSGSRIAPLSVQDASGRELIRFDLENAAIATSSRNGYRFADGTGHILSPRDKVESQWETASVVAGDATRADGFSTALVIASGTQLAEQLIETGEIKRVILQGRDGKVRDLSLP